jgi:hypothetical protein
MAQSRHPGRIQPDIREALMLEFFFIAWIIFLVVGTVVLITSMMIDALLDVWDNLRRHLR